MARILVILFLLNASEISEVLAASEQSVSDGRRERVIAVCASTQLKNVQELIPMELRYTQLGGLGITKTAKRFKREWMKKLESME